MERPLDIEAACVWEISPISCQKSKICLYGTPKAVFTDRTRFRVLGWAPLRQIVPRLHRLVRGAIEKPGEVFFYAAPTYRMAKDIAWN